MGKPLLFKRNWRSDELTLEELDDLAEGATLGACGLGVAIAEGDDSHNGLALWDIEQLAQAFGTPEEMAEISRVSLKVNEILTAYLKDINIELIDFKLEFGRYHGKIIVADEITPDTARFWDAGTHEPLDIDRFRRDMDNVAEAYQEVLHRMMGVG